MTGGEKPYKSGELPFTAEGRLLQELGERLVVSADLAVTELIKNAYDADASVCRVALDDTTLAIEDNGIGMSFDDFQHRWMTIATSSRQLQSNSKVFGRILTGAKGIGRFAVRFLGERLEMVSTALDRSSGRYTRLEAEFDWKGMDKLQSLTESKVPYKVYLLENPGQTGTVLTIKNLKQNTIVPEEVRSGVLKMVTPLTGLDRGKFRSLSARANVDPGFNVKFEGKLAGSVAGEGELAKTVLSNCWSRLVIKLEDDTVEYDVAFSYPQREQMKPLRFKCETHVQNGLFADIRYFPRRAGIFQGKGFDGNMAWDWVRDNSGVAIIDHGFRIKPYGFPRNDWLFLDLDHSHNERNWRSEMMKSKFPMSDEQRQQPSLNPMINLPINYQLVGAVSVESRQRGKDVVDLIPAMDREGFIENTAFQDLREIIRAGIEFMALLDKEEELARQEKLAKESVKTLRRDFRQAMDELRSDETLPASVKNKLIAEYSKLASEISSVDEYSRKARENLEVVSLLGVVSGFMTHEADRIRSDLKSLISTLRTLARKEPSLRQEVERVDRSITELEGQLAYSAMFIKSIHDLEPTRFKLRPQVELLVERFGGYAKRRNIEHLIEIESGLLTPRLHVNVYSGIVLNLYTNAVKAILMRNQTRGRILIKAWNRNDMHVLEVADNGVGIPESLRDRIWDPLFTTTSKLNSPLGTGMGLGLSLARKMARDSGGDVRIVDPPKDYITCFRLEFPI